MKVVDGAKKRKQSNVKSQDILRLLSNRISKRSNDLIHRVLCCNVFSLSVRPKSKSASSQKKKPNETTCHIPAAPSIEYYLARRLSTGVIQSSTHHQQQLHQVLFCNRSAIYPSTRTTTKGRNVRFIYISLIMVRLS